MQEIFHFFLTKAENPFQAGENVKKFLDKYELVRYDLFEIKDFFIHKPTSERFWEILEYSIEKNKETLLNFLKELKREGFSKIEDILEIS